MTHRPAGPSESEASAWPAVEGADPIEFTGHAAGDDRDTSASSTHSKTPPPTATPPAWFRKTPDAASSDKSNQCKRRTRRERSDQGSRQPNVVPAPAVPTREAPTTTDWKKHWKSIAIAWLVSNESRGLVVSTLVHVALLVGLSAIIYQNLEENQAHSVIITDVNTLSTDFSEVMALTMESASSPDSQLPQLQEILSTTDPVFSTNMLTTAGQIAGSDDGGDNLDGLGFKFAMPTGGKAITKGNFSVWTVPEDPVPRKDYMIVIRIRLPKKTRLYRISDLSGKVVGSDAYQQYLPFDPNHSELTAKIERRGQTVKVQKGDRLRVINNHVQILIPVKGASNLVRDTIEVKSRMLNESQEIEIVF